MKKSLLVLAIASTLAACGGGGGNTSSISIPNVVQKNYGEIYIGPQGGPLTLDFVPNQIPSWVKTNNGKFSVDPADCSNRTTELVSPVGQITLHQTSKYRCDLPDYANDANFLKEIFFVQTAVESTQRVYTNSIIDSRFAKVNGEDWPKKRGLNQLKFTVENGDCAGTDCTRPDPRDRSELTFRSLPNKEYWAAFSFFVPTPYIEQGFQFNTNQELTFFQLMYTDEVAGNRNYSPLLMIGKKYNSDVTATTWVNELLPKLRTTSTLISDNNFEGHWHEVLLKFTPSLVESSTPTLEIWVNGVQKLKFSNQTLFRSDGEIWFKFGLYRPQNTSNPSQSIYFDEVRFAHTRAEVEFK